MPRIAFLFSGQVRKNSLNPDEQTDETILDSFHMNLFNDELKAKYDYDVFISTDKLNIDKATAFFEGHLKNVHLYETGYYLNQVHLETPPYEKATARSFQFDGKFVANGNLYQSYRQLDAHNLLTDYVNKTDTQYDLLVRIRLDTILLKPFNQHFKEIIENPDIYAIAFQDQFIIGRPAIMKVFLRGLETKYCLYRSPLGNPGDWVNFIMTNEQYFKHFYDHYCQWAPEMQSTCLFLEYCYKNNINTTKALLGYDRNQYLSA
jgi:hypothetical protein